MIRPVVAPRVEETHELAGLEIDGTDIASLPRITSKASISKVVELR
jgi:uncharacterized protein YqfA (UPF0365 family)